METENFVSDLKKCLREENKQMELALAPMLKVTTPCFRKLMGHISPHVILYTEMIVANTVNNVSEEKLKYLLGEPANKTVVQLGGSEPDQLAMAVKRLKSLGYSQFNLNCGCPSDKVQKGMFGAVLMKHKELVADIINRVYDETGVIISLKTRIGVDENDTYEFLHSFIDHIITNTKCRVFYIHARKCWLEGLSPKQNRNIPPLKYNFVYKIKQEFPTVFVGINGGITHNSYIKNKNDIDQYTDGIMIGREAYNNLEIFNNMINRSVDMKMCVKLYLEWCNGAEYSKSTIIHPLINARKNKGNSKAYKRMLNNIMHNKDIKTCEIYNNIEEYFDN